MTIGAFTIDWSRRWAFRRHVAREGCYHVCSFHHVGPLLITRWAR